MTELINNKLLSLAAEKQITVLHAVESGSRAWGFASPDSDYDIRFIYKHAPDYYLSLWEKPDVIEFMTSEDLDGSGWDIAKALKLLAKSNVPLIEWLYSPVVYYTNNDFLKQMQLFANDCFSPVAALHHYLGTTKNFIEACSLEQVKLKSYFYALRTAIAGKWIIDNNTFPPVDFFELLPIVPDAIKEKIMELQAVKAQSDEKYLHPKEPLITDFLNETIKYNSEKAPGLSAGIKINKNLEDFFREIIKS